MKTYIAVLRGINVSGHRIIKMEALRQLFSDLGFVNIKTYIQSGNVIFDSKQFGNKLLSTKIELEILKKFEFEVPVIVKDLTELKDILQANPFLNDSTKDNSFFHVTFLSEKPANENVGKIFHLQFQHDEFIIVDEVIYLYCPEGYSNSKLTNSFFENKLKVKATTRNWKTVNELVNIADSSK